MTYRIHTFCINKVLLQTSEGAKSKGVPVTGKTPYIYICKKLQLKTTGVKLTEVICFIQLNARFNCYLLQFRHHFHVLSCCNDFSFL